MSVVTTITAETVAEAIRDRIANRLDGLATEGFEWSSHQRYTNFVQALENMTVSVDSERCVVVSTDSVAHGYAAGDMLDFTLVDLDSDGSLFDGEIELIAPGTYCYAW